MKLDHDVHLEPDRRTNLAEGLQGPVEIADGDIVAAARLGVGVERPDLHAGDPLLAQAQRQLACPVQEGVEILVRTLSLLRHLRQAPVADLLLGASPHVAIAGAGVIDADPFPAGTTEQLVNRLADVAPKEVPERDVDCRVAPSLDATGGIADVRGQCSRVLVDVEGILPQEVRRDRLVNVRLDRLGPEKRLPETGDALIRVHPHPEQVRELPEPQRFDRADFHELPPYMPLIPNPSLPLSPSERGEGSTEVA